MRGAIGGPTLLATLIRTATDTATEGLFALAESRVFYLGRGRLRSDRPRDRLGPVVGHYRYLTSCGLREVPTLWSFAHKTNYDRRDEHPPSPQVNMPRRASTIETLPANRFQA
jgi:hypothetical protein